MSFSGYTCRRCGSAAVVRIEERERTRITCSTCSRVWFRDRIQQADPKPLPHPSTLWYSGVN